MTTVGVVCARWAWPVVTGIDAQRARVSALTGADCSAVGARTGDMSLGTDGEERLPTGSLFDAKENGGADFQCRAVDHRYPARTQAGRPFTLSQPELGAAN